MISCVYVTPFTRDLIFPRSVLYSQPKGVSFQLLRLFPHNTSFGKQGLISVEAATLCFLLVVMMAIFSLTIVKEISESLF